MMLDLNYIHESLLKLLVLKCLILSVEICSISFENSKEWREHNTCILPNQLYRLSHRILSYKMSSDVNECILIHSFKLNHTALPTDKFHSTEEHDQAQNNILEVHSLMSHSSYTREFDVKTYIVDLVEYKLCSLHSLTFQRVLQIFTLSIRHFNTNILGILKDDVAETYWQRKVSSPWRINPAWWEGKFLQKYKIPFVHFRRHLITILDRE